MNSTNKQEPVIRNTIRPGDIGAIIKLHGEYYFNNHGFDSTFEPYVAIPLSEFVIRNSNKEKIWIVEYKNEVKGCIAIVDYENNIAQLRWYVLDKDIQGRGIGRQLIEEALKFVRDKGYKKVLLWTVSEQLKAIKIYEKNGFSCIEKKHHDILWGKEITELCYEKVI
jgi:GNAT superfamily N-acetyltransferase